MIRGKNKILNWYCQKSVYAFIGDKRNKLDLVIGYSNLGKFLSIILFAILLSSVNVLGQSVTVWEENFTYSNGTSSGTNSGISWSTSGLNGNSGVGVFNNELRGRRTNANGYNTWEISNSIDVSDYVNISISMDVSSSNTLESNNDFMQIEYSLDGGSWTIFESNGFLQGNINGTLVASQTGLSGATLLLRIVMQNNNWNENYYVDNLKVTGLTTVLPSCVNPAFPVNGETDVAIDTELDWNSDVYASDYYLYFGTDNPPTNIINGDVYTASFYSPPTDLNINTTYYWKVVPNNSVGTAAGCPVWSFTTGMTAEVDTVVRQLFNAGQDLIFNFPFNDCKITSDLLLTVTIKGDINEANSNEFYYIIGESGNIGQIGPTLSGGANDCDLATQQFTILNADVQSQLADNILTFVANPQSGVNEFCPGSDPSYVEMRLRYSYATIPTCNIIGPSAVCTNEQNVIFSAPAEMTSYLWSVSGDASISGSSTSSTLNVNTGSSDFTVSLSIESYPGCSSSCTYDVTVDPGSVVVGVASADQTLCFGDTPAPINLTGHSGTIQWQKSTDNLIFTDITGATGATLTIAQMGALSSKTYFRAMVDGGLCTARTNVVTVTVLADLSASISGGISEICSGTSPGTFVATSSGGSGSYSFQWYLNGNPTSTSQSYDPGILTGNASVYCAVSSNPCGTVNTSAVNILVDQTATPAIGTITQPDCITPTGTIELNGLPATGAWELTQNPGGITTIQSGTSTTISGLAPGTYNYTVSSIGTDITCPGSGTGLMAEYFNNMTLTGSPVYTRTDPTVNFDWGTGNPGAPINNDGFSVRWTGKILPCYSETYTFSTNSDDGIRLWVNGTQIINNWTDHAPTINTGTIDLIAGQIYDIVLEFYENGGGAVAQLSWSSASQIAQIIPQSNLYLNSDFVTNCVSLPTANIVINPPPAIISQPTDLTICEGGSGSFIVATNAAAPTYQWEYTNSLAGPITWTPVVDNANISGATSAELQLVNTPTLYTGIYASCLITVAGCQLRTTPVLLTVNALPTAGITNNTGTTELSCTLPAISVTATGAAGYSWSDGASEISTNANLTISIPGTYTVTVSTVDGCTDTQSITITQDNTIPVVSITGSAAICVSETSTLSPTTGGTWISNNPAIATVTNAGLVTAISSGSATFTYTDTNSGCSSTTTAITVNEAVCNIVGTTTACPLESNIAFSGTAGMVGYSWSILSGDATIDAPGNTENITVSAGTGNFTLQLVVTAASGCSNTCSISVNVEDLSAPVIMCPANINETVPVGGTGRNVTWTLPSVSDNCDSNVDLINTNIPQLNPGDYINTGTTTVTYQATDDKGNVSTCSFDINVTEFDCNAQAVNANGFEEWIAQIDVGSYSNSSSSSNYTDFTSEVIDLENNTSHSITLTPGFSSSSFDEYWSVWIDFNQDGDYSDLGENLYSGTSASAITSFITIPDIEVITSMRIAMQGYHSGNDLTAPGGNVTSEFTDWPAGEDISMLIDDNSATKYLTFNNSGWVQYQFPSGRYVVTKYSITSANDVPTRDPKDWILQGSNDGTSWTTVDSRTNEDFPTRFETREFVFTNTIAYEYYRLDMVNDGAGELQLAEWELFETDNTPYPAPCETFSYGEVEDYTVNIGPACDADVPTLTVATNPVCSGSDVTLNISGNLNSAQEWKIYTGSCGGTEIGTSSGSTFDISNLTSTTTYYVRGEGGCLYPGPCGSITLTVNSIPTIALSSTEANACEGDNLTTLVYSATSGGPNQYNIDFDATAEGQGFIDVSNASLSGGTINISVPINANPDTYNAVLTVRNSTTGCISTTTNITVIINPLPNTGEITTDN